MTEKMANTKPQTVGELLKTARGIVMPVQNLSSKISEMNLLEPGEKELIALKYKSRCFGELSREEISLVVKALLLRVNVITGWTLPEDVEFRSILYDQVGKKLVQDYHNVNSDEIEYAFRLRAHLVEDYGKGFTLAGFCKVVNPYLSERATASELEMAHKSRNAWVDLRTSVDWRGQIEENYQHFILGSPFYQRDVHPFVYDQLEEDGFIERGAYKFQFRKYQKRFLKDDGTCMRMAKNFFVQLLFRMAVKQKRQCLYKLSHGKTKH